MHRRHGRVELPLKVGGKLVVHGSKVFELQCIWDILHKDTTYIHCLVQVSAFVCVSDAATPFDFFFLDRMGLLCSVSISLLSFSLVSMYFEECLHHNQNVSGCTETLVVCFHPASVAPIFPQYQGGESLLTGRDTFPLCRDLRATTQTDRQAD